MIEILSGALFVTIIAVLYLANKVSRTSNNMRIAEEKVRSLEVKNEQITFKQNIDNELDNASDVYLADILRSKGK